ncbi:lipopolysaccharide biosynthesis protein [Ekhidna sp.]|uniref:lipopolysaccharide biosynthesis protein n=1 Tax=Ekhidna sp. TaxID=2608089 RepID=UPI003BA8FECB
MGVVIKQSFWGTVISYIGVIVGYVNTLYVRVEYLDLGQIGLFTLITSNAMMVSPVSSLGMGSSFVKYFPAFQKGSNNQFFSFLFLITLGGNALVLFVCYLFKDAITLRYLVNAPSYVHYLSITAIIIVSNSFFDLFFSYSRSIKKVIFPSFLRDIFLRLGALLLVIGFAMDWWDFDGAVIGLGVNYSLAFLSLIAQLMIKHGFRFDFQFVFISKEWGLKLFQFGSYSMLLAGSFALINNATYDQVTTILGPEMNGIFTTCFFIAMIVEMPRRNMSKVVGPILSEEFEKQNMDEVGRLYKRGSITMSIIGMLLFIGIITNLQDLFDFIPKGSEFQMGFWIVIGVCATKLMLMISSFAGEIINFSHLYRYNLFFQVLAAIILVSMNHFLISIYGLNGAVISYFTAITIHIIVKLLFVKYHFRIHPFVRSHIPLFVIGAVITIGAYLFQPALNPILKITIRSILTTLFFVFLIYKFRISADINKIIHSTFERFLKINLPK